MKKVIVFILQSIADNIIQFVFALIIIWLGIPALLPSLKKYSWDFLGSALSLKINLGIIIITILGFVILYILLKKYIFSDSRLKEYGGLLWKVNKKSLKVSSIPNCLKHRAKLVEKYIPHEEYPYFIYYCPICGKDFKPELTSYDIDNLYSEAESVIQSRYNT